MNEADSKIKQQIVSKIGSSTNILVTVSKDPSVDELSAAIGLTTLLNKLGKHATAIFSGILPPAINFLDPDKVFENSADSLRDFIIALDKEKADHLRYKVEGDVVKIFITPYRTTITSDDLNFSQGDYNIELVLALGVDNQEHLDTALAAHEGQVLHDVTIATFSAGTKISQLGSMDWHDNNASSLSEMVTDISESLNGNKPILDKQISTALLTGIVAATDRFSNTLTSSRVMTIAAQLMAAGADQQLIAAKLQESHEINVLADEPSEQDSTQPIPELEPEVIEAEVPSSTLPVGSLVVDHKPDITPEQSLDTIVANANNNISTISNDELADIQPDLPVAPEVSSTLSPVYAAEGSLQSEGSPTEEPSLGGALNATTDQAAEDTRRDMSDQQNKTILTHSYLGDSEPDNATPINGIGQVEDSKDVDIFAGDTTPPATNEEPLTGERVIMPPQQVVQPPVLDLPLPPELPDFSTLPPPTSVSNFNAPASTQQPEPSTIPAPANNDPAQFKIPGQQ